MSHIRDGQGLKTHSHLLAPLGLAAAPQWQTSVTNMPILQRGRLWLGHVGLSARSSKEKEVRRGGSVGDRCLALAAPTAGNSSLVPQLHSRAMLCSYLPVIGIGKRSVCYPASWVDFRQWRCAPWGTAGVTILRLVKKQQDRPGRQWQGQRHREGAGVGGGHIQVCMSDRMSSVGSLGPLGEAEGEGQAL